MSQNEVVPEFTIKGFRGAVILKDWMHYPYTGQSVMSLTGQISIHEAKEVVGFEVQKTESNWAALIKGPRSNVWILGCQVRSIIADPEIVANGLNTVEVQ